MANNEDIKQRMLREESMRLLKEELDGMDVLEVLAFNLALNGVIDIFHGLPVNIRIKVVHVLSQYYKIVEGLSK